MPDHQVSSRPTAAPALALMLAAALSLSAAACAQEAALRFYAPLDQHARGVLLPQSVGIEPTAEFRPAEAKVAGGAALTPDVGLQFPLAPFLSNEEGSVAVWLKVNWDPAETATRMLINLGRFGCLRRWQDQQYLTYTLWYHHLDEKHDYGCTSPIEAWQLGQWRHLVITWSWSERRRVLYVDGKLAREATIDRIPNVITALQIGPDAEVADELCVYGRPIDAAEVERLYAAGSAGKPAFDLGAIPPAAGALQRLPDSTAPPPSDFVNWSLQGAESRDNGLRGEVTLHGWWRWQRGVSPYDPPDDSRWLYRKVPNQSHFAESFPVRDEQLKVVGADDPRVGQQILNGVPQWCEREFVPPAAWRGRRVVLEVDALVYESALFLNGRLLEALPRVNLGGDYDLTDQLTWEAPDRLTIFSSGVDGDIRLVSFPAGPTVDDAWLVTSWRNRSVTARLRVGSPAPLTVAVQVDITDGDDPRPVKTLSARRSLQAGTNAVELSQSWPDARPWSLSDPHLYSYRVRLLDDSGAVVDEALPARFGFREIWIEDGDFYLNGRPVHFIGHSNAHLTAASELGDPEYLRYSLGQWRKAGLNAVTPWQGTGRSPTCHPLLDVADEMGMAIFPVPGLPRGEYEAETPALRAQWESLHRRYLERYRQHPSVLGWLIGSGSHLYDFCPGVLDGRFEPDIAKAEPLRRTWDFVRRVDDTRPAFGISNGNIGPVWTSMAYQGFDVDLQERENWPLRWSQARHKPLMPCEFSLPYYRDWFARTPKRSGRAQYAPENTQALSTEYAAMFLGPSVYLSEPAEYLEGLQSSPGSPKRSRAFWQVKGLFADTLRAWRAYGASFVYHAEVPDFFQGESPSFPTVAQLDPRRRGATPENLHGSLQARDDLSEFGQRVRDATAPLMAFIGGPDGRFTLKDHACWSGETVRKALVVVNDTDESVRLDANWSLRDAEGRGLARGRVRVEVGPGRQELRRALIEFEAPAVERRTDFALTVSARSSDRQSVEVRPFAITVFPRDFPDLPSTADLALFDPVGDTSAALARLGLRPAAMPPRLTPRHRLLIGRHVLEDEAHLAALRDAGFDEAVAQGMRALIFEQSAPGWDGTLMGLRLKRLATRRAFVRAPGHPVFEGLAESDFRFLRGDSDLIEPYPDPGPMPDAYPVHFWHWGNDNTVATATLEKPQVGVSRALLDCGFDLAEAALLEAARGEGLLLFCQVDVTNRIAQDPVSTRLALNLLVYLLQAPARDPASASLRELVERHPPADTVQAYFSATLSVAGLHPGEAFFRESLALPAFDADSPTPLFAQVEQEGRNYWLTSLSAAELNTDWQRAKRARIEAALRWINGERAADGPALRRHDDPERLYPHHWARIPGMEDDFDPYVYWRW